jgi:hypothetical protein
MAPSTETQIHVIADASKARAAIAVLSPLAFPFIVVFGLGTSGHSLSDYPGLIASGQLSWLRQSAMWVAIVAYAAIYGPPAFTALAARTYIGSTNRDLIIPSAERLDLASIEAVSVRKTFWQKLLIIQSSGLTRRVVITFAKPGTDDIRSALKGDSNLRNVSVT